jgi:hypothetical protein
MPGGKCHVETKGRKHKKGGNRRAILRETQNIENTKRIIERQNTNKMKKAKNVEESYFPEVGNFLPDYTET